jgi:hypothetical protein
LDDEIAVSEGAFLINPAHPAPFRRQPPDPDNVIAGQVAQQVQVVVPAGEPSDRNRTIKPDLTRRNRFGDVGELFKTMGCDNQVPCRLRGHVEAPGNPLTKRPAPRPRRHLTTINLTQQHHLRRPLSSNHRFTAKQLSLDLVDGGGLYIHTRNLSHGCDRNGRVGPQNLRYFQALLGLAIV